MRLRKIFQQGLEIVGGKSFETNHGRRKL